MADVLESLEIQVKHNATGADAAINKVADAITNLKNATTGTPASLKELASAMNAMSNAFKGGLSKLSTFADGVADIAAAAGLLSGSTAALTELASALTTISGVSLKSTLLGAFSSSLSKFASSLAEVEPHTGALTDLAIVMSALSGITLPATSITSLAKAITTMSEALPTIGTSLTALTTLASVLSGLSTLGFDTRMWHGIARAIEHIGKAAESLTADALTNLDRLVTALGMLSTLDLSGAAASLGSVSRDLPRVASGMNKAGSGVKGLGDSAGKANTAVSKLMSSLGRIAFYRAIRSIIKAIADAFRQGSENAYFFSESIATIGHRFATALNELSTKSLTMKNQLGSAFNALMTAVAPVIEYLIGLVTRLADAMAQFFSIFTGGTYLKAVDVPNKWATDANKAAGATKEWKNQLLGFDEINRLNEPNDGGGGGGSDKLDPTTMFQDTPISGIFARIKKELDDFWGSIDFEPLKKAWEDLKKSLQGVADIVGGALKWGWENVLKPLAKWTLEKFTPAFVTLLSGAIGLLTVALNLFKPAGKWLWENFLQPILSFAGDTFILFLETLGTVLGDLRDIITGDKSWGDLWDDLIEKFRTFSSGLEDIDGIVTAAEVALSGLSLAFAASSGGMSLLVGAVLIGAVELVRNWDKITASVVALKDALIERWDTIKEKWNAFLQDEPAVNRALNDLEFVIGGVGVALAGMTGGWSLAVAGIAIAVIEIKRNWTSIQNAFSRAVESIKGAWQTLVDKVAAGKADLTADWETIKQGWVNFKATLANGILNLKSNWETFKGTVTTACDTLSEKWQNVRNIWDNWMEPIAAKVTEWKNSLVQAFNAVKNKIIAIYNWLVNAIAALRDFLGLGGVIERADQHAQDIWDTGEIWNGMNFATGGFPQEGEIFLARESGPEMVGTIGGRTAVANNDQIVEGIRQGVFEAVSAAMSNRSGSQEIRVYLDSREIRAGQQRLNRAWGA